MSMLSALQPGSGTIRATEYLAASRDNVLWGRLPCATDRAVLEIDPGTDVTIDTISHEGVLEDQGRDPAAFFAAHGVTRDFVLDDAVALAASDYPRSKADGPHVITGPIAVRGARPGDLLKMTVLETTPRVPYGVISNRHGKGALVGELPAGDADVSIFAELQNTLSGASFGTLPVTPGGERSVRFPLAPFLGIMGVAVAGDERPNSVPPGPHGGNIDINLLTTGSSLYLPVQVPGALAYVGDPHFAQGDGEVALTAMEASLRVTIRFDLVDQSEARAQFGELVGPMAETSEFLVPTGMDVDLDVAVQNCVRAALALLEARYGMDRALAYAYLSAATDFNISQVVDIVKGVHARVRVADFAGVGVQGVGGHGAGGHDGGAHGAGAHGTGGRGAGAHGG
ncbi:acetamidase/formamidase family protein [Herbiconiux daphne]|uniref:Acetamidase/formamidase family protein n=1 Tax=Herbiconiux daphne TaxID=2970914 RepID=A0ABT2H8U5_9MICO|nr:acetamidase/formamidase family protein [Herbiconiux daphne]MCS5736322.1 acetamidase/formamidase family protein [Herbiconiux daphne]